MATATRAPFQCLPPFIYVVFCGTTDDVAAEEVFSPTSPSVSAIRGSTKVPCLRPPLAAFPRKSLSRCAHAWSRLGHGRYSSLPQVVATGTSRSSWKWHDGQKILDDVHEQCSAHLVRSFFPFPSQFLLPLLSLFFIFYPLFGFRTWGFGESGVPTPWWFPVIFFAMLSLPYFNFLFLILWWSNSVFPY